MQHHRRTLFRGELRRLARGLMRRLLGRLAGSRRGGLLHRCAESLARSLLHCTCTGRHVGGLGGCLLHALLEERALGHQLVLQPIHLRLEGRRLLRQLALHLLREQGRAATALSDRGRHGAFSIELRLNRRS